MRARLSLFSLLALAVLAMPASATIDAQSNGSDGALVVNASTPNLVGGVYYMIDLGRAATGAWNMSSPVQGAGVYDSTKWAVVFKYSSISIAPGYHVKFINHPSNAPVVWLVQGVANIEGTVWLDGENGTTANRESVPGPGGFPGGRGTYVGSPGTAGHGPGGGPTTNDYRVGGAYGTAAVNGGGTVYGNSRILPLIGGSGAGGSSVGSVSGGAGGGAILMVVGQRCALTGLVRAYGGSEGSSGGYSGEASGGAVRIVADTLSGNGGIVAFSWNNYGGQGRVRLEANVNAFASQTAPAYSQLQPLGPDGVVLWPPAPEPTLKIKTINGQPVTGDPHMDAQALASGDLVINNTSLVPVTIEAFNLPLTATVTVRVVLGLSDAYVSAPATHTGDATHSFWSIELPALSPERVSALQVKAVLP